MFLTDSENFYLLDTIQELEEKTESASNKVLEEMREGEYHKPCHVLV